MFAMQRDRSSSGSSTRSTSSARSLSLSPGGWNPSKAAASPATTTTTPFGVSPAENPHDQLAPLHGNHRKLLGGRRLETFAPESAYNSYAYPCWPAGTSLSHRRTASQQSGSSRIASAYSPHYAPPSSRISDDDLEHLDFNRRARGSASSEEIEGGISWSQVGTGAPGQAPCTGVAGGERRRRLPPPPPAMERRASDRGTRRRKTVRTATAH